MVELGFKHRLSDIRIHVHKLCTNCYSWHLPLFEVIRTANSSISKHVLNPSILSTTVNTSLILAFCWDCHHNTLRSLILLLPSLPSLTQYPQSFFIKKQDLSLNVIFSWEVFHDPHIWITSPIIFSITLLFSFIVNLIIGNYTLVYFLK